MQQQEDESDVESGGVKGPSTGPQQGLETLLAELADVARPISASKLVRLSDLRRTGVQVFSEGWLEIPDPRRLEVVSKLVDLAEDNVELDFTPLFRRLLTDEDARVRSQAIAGLWECQERSLIEPLVRLLTDDSEESVRAAAAQGLGRFVLMAETAKLLERDSQRIASVLLEVIDNDSETIEVRRRAIEAVAPMGIPRVREIIKQAYESDDTTFKASAIYAMGLTCDPDWLPTVLKEAGSDDPEMRYEAAVALGEIGEEETAHRLGLLVKDDDLMVQAAALNALGNMGGPAAKRLLNNALESDDPRIVELADLALKSADFDQVEPMNYQGFSRGRS